MKATVILVCLCGLVLTACVNLKPVADNLRLYVLGEVEGAAVESIAESSEDRYYVVRPDIPTYLSHDRIMLRERSGAIVELMDERWAEPLEEEVCRALSEYVSRKGGRWVSGYYPWPRLDPDCPQLRVRFNELSIGADGSLRASVFWVVSQRQNVIRSGLYNAYELTWEPGRTETLVLAMNRMLEGLAVNIVGAE